MFRLDNFSHYGGHAYVARLPHELRIDEERLDPGTSEFILLEDGVPLGPVCFVHQVIADAGAGRYCRWEDSIYLSSSDNSVVPDNGREYTVGVGEPVLIARAMKLVASGLTAERTGLVKECLRNIYRGGEAATIEEVAGERSLRGERILEVGASKCWAAPLYLAAGADTYTALDTQMERDSDRIFNRSYASEHWTADHYIPMPLTLGEFLECFDRIRVVEGEFAESGLPGGAFDFVFMRAVSEHLMRFRACMNEVARLVRPDAELYLSHGNYYSWNGHHVTPHTVAEIDDSNPELTPVHDWNHLRAVVEDEDPDYRGLNYVRLHELIDVLSLDFEILSCSLHPSSAEHGGERLTEEIRRSLPAFYREELVTDTAYIRARRRAVAPPSSHPVQPDAEKAFVLSAWDERLQSVAAWLRDGGDILQLSRRCGIGVADLVEIRDEFKQGQRGTSDPPS